MTTRQREVLAFMASYHRSNGFPPSIREIANRFGIRSANGVVCHLRALERMGYIERASRLARAIRILRTK